MTGLRLLLVLACGLMFHVVQGSTNPTSRRKLRDPIARPEFNEYELAEHTQSEPPPARRHYNAFESNSDESEPGHWGTSAPIKITGRNHHPLLDFDFASHNIPRSRENAVHNVQNAFKHHHRSPLKDVGGVRKGDTVRRSSSDFWAEYKRREDRELVNGRRVVNFRGPTPPRRRRNRNPAVTYQIFLTPSESSSTSSGDACWRRPMRFSLAESSEDDESQNSHSTEVDLIFELSIADPTR